MGGGSTEGPVSNSITDIKVSGNTVWISAGDGLSRTTDEGLTWTTFTRSDGLGRGGVSALAFQGDTVWVATVFDTITIVEGADIAGGGLSFTTDNGLT